MAEKADSVYRDGGTPEPLTDGEMEGIRSAMEFYDSTSLIPRLLATIDRDRAGRAAPPAAHGAPRSCAVASAHLVPDGS